MIWTIYHKKEQNVNKVVFWLPYKILDHCIFTYCQKATEAKDTWDKWQMNKSLETIIEYKKKKKLMRNDN
jgi:hypothetical protein